MWRVGDLLVVLPASVLYTLLTCSSLSDFDHKLFWQEFLPRSLLKTGFEISCSHNPTPRQAERIRTPANKLFTEIQMVHDIPKKLKSALINNSNSAINCSSPSTMAQPGKQVLHETIALGSLTVPRVWNGLWQVSGNAWGSAPVSRMQESMARLVNGGFYAFGWR